MLWAPSRLQAGRPLLLLVVDMCETVEGCDYGFHLLGTFLQVIGIRFAASGVTAAVVARVSP